MKKLYKNSIFVLVVIELLVVVVLFLLGFKIVYAPELKNDWSAIEAVGTWVSGALIPFVLLFLQKKMSENVEKTRTSNLALLEELSEFKKRYEPILEEWKKSDSELYNKSDEVPIVSQNDIYRYICISMIATSKEIADHFGVSVDSIRSTLEDMWAVQEIIKPASLEDDPNRNMEYCSWVKD